MSESQNVHVVVQPGVNLLDLAGPVQVFDTAVHFGAGYRVRHVGHLPSVTSAQGLVLAELDPLPEPAPGDLVLVPGARLHRDRPLAAPEVVRWLRDHRDSGARFAAVCTGAAALGEAGLLDGRACTTHWELVGPMRARYPRARVRDAVLYVHDGPVSTSAGISAGVDLALSLVERDHGPSLTAAVARYLVVYLRRDGDQAQLSPFLRDRDHLDAVVHRVQDHIAQHLDGRTTLTDLAAVAHVSPRGLTRAFRAAIGVTPLEYRQRLRLGLAAALLSGTDLPVAAVATRCGFADARHLRRLYATRFGTSPAATR